MSKYQQGKIYKVIDNTNNNVYIGSTIHPLGIRLSKHRTDWKLYNEGKRAYRKVYEIIKNNDYRIELIKEYPCETKKELCWEEGFIQLTTPCINENIAGYKRRQLKRLKLMNFYKST